MEDFSPSNCEILEAKIKSHLKDKETDIFPIIGKIGFSQSITQVAWTGSARIYDTTGLLESFPLRGEEELFLRLVSNDTKYEVSLSCQIYKIDNMKTMESNNGVMYTIHFISKTSYESGKRRIINSFKDVSGSDIVKQIFKKYFAELKPASEKEILPFGTNKYKLNDTYNRNRRLYIQPTQGFMRVVIPNYGSGAAMNFIAGKSYSTTSPSCSYKFFETFEGYHFVTDEFLIKKAIENKKVINLFYDTFVSLDPKKVLEQVDTIETFTNTNRVDVAKDTHSGGYMNKVIEIDYVRRKVTENIFDFSNSAGYIDTTGNVTTISNDIHTEDFIKDSFTEENSMRMLVYKDYSQEGDIPGTLRADQYYNEIISRRISNQHHMSSIGVSIGMKGRLDIAAGNLININASAFSGSSDKTDNDQIGGYYLVQAVTHTIDKSVLTTEARLIKYDWSKT